jgi:ABC-type phosphate/phosphonate transport system ATPase subunit
MYFVGRQQEIARILKDLERGDNVSVCGKYGIGRTSLLKHLAEITPARI